MSVNVVVGVHELEEDISDAAVSERHEVGNHINIDAYIHPYVHAIIHVLFGSWS